MSDTWFYNDSRQIESYDDQTQGIIKSLILASKSNTG